MFKNIKKIICAYFAVAVMITTPMIVNLIQTDIEPVKMVEPMAIEKTVEVETEVYASTPVVHEVKYIEKEVEEEFPLTTEEIELIALLTMAEAEGESDEGKRLVIDTVLNRVDSELAYFPDTVTEVIYQPDQFTSMWNGRVDKCYVSEEICQLVKEELKNRTNSEVLWFRTKTFSNYGIPMLVEGNHYFSSI